MQIRWNGRLTAAAVRIAADPKADDGTTLGARARELVAGLMTMSAPWELTPAQVDHVQMMRSRFMGEDGTAAFEHAWGCEWDAAKVRAR